MTTETAEHDPRKLAEAERKAEEIYKIAHQFHVEFWGEDYVRDRNEIGWWVTGYETTTYGPFATRGEANACLHNRRLAAIAEALTPAPGWRPIETAPDDGTPVLVARRTTGGPEILVAYYTGDKWSEYWDRATIELVLAWQPLPEPPIAAHERESKEPK